MTSNLPILPVALPMVAGIVLIFLRDRPRFSRGFALAANLVVLGVAVTLVQRVRTDGIQVLNFGEWPAPFGIVFAVDMLGALMVLVTMVVSTATLLFACFSLDEARERMFFYALFEFLLMGCNGSFLTGDLFNMFVWFEVLLISSYGLMALGSEPYQLQETFKYLVINAMSSSLFLVGVALIYSLTGTLNMADISLKLAEVSDHGTLAAVAVIFLMVFAIKGALFPVYQWLPRSYFAPPTVVSALFGGLLTKVGVYALYRVTSLFFAAHVPFLLPLLAFVAGATMLLGVLGALSQWDMKRILSYHIISQIGYMIMGLAIFTPLALAGGIFYIIHHILVKTSLFLVAGSVEASRGTTHLRRLGGVIDQAPTLSGLFFVAGLALAGTPPLSGFIAKFMLIRGGMEGGYNLTVLIAVLTGFLTLFSMMKIFRYGFWQTADDSTYEPGGATPRVVAIAVLVGSGVILGIGASFFVPYAQLAAQQLLHPQAYVQAVLGSH